MAAKAKIDLRTARLLDANLNRAREGLRVVEDAARFIWNDRRMYQRLRGFRHGLHEITAAHYKDLVLSRDSRNDVGRVIKEGGRASAQAVIAANVRRAEEALRVLEEYSKVFSPQAGPRFKAIRYALYTEEKKILRKR